MSGTVALTRAADGVWIIAPAGAPTVVDDAPGIDVMVLDVVGGYLSWSVLAGQSTPAAVIDDVVVAQEWIWAVYGERIAMAVDEFDGESIELPTEPELPELVANAWRLGYAHWAARWWPASIIDGIGPLDEHLLDQEIAALQAKCDLLVEQDEPAHRALSSVEIPARADDYALAAGSDSGIPTSALILARGTGGWDWHRCPPGLIDASEQAVSWQVLRAGGTTTVRVDVVAAPQLPSDIPAHLRPRALITVADGTIETELNLAGDTWSGQVRTDAEAASAVDVYVPGLGTPGLGSADDRHRVRDLAADRLRRATGVDDAAFDSPLLAEIAAAAAESDF